MIKEVLYVEGEKRSRPEMQIMQSIYNVLKKYKLRNPENGRLKVSIKIERIKND